MDAAGLSGGAPIAIGGGSVGDLFSERDRASAMAIYNLGPLIGTSTDTSLSPMSDQLPLLGPAMGPIAGGFIAQTVGVKWVFIVISSLSYPIYRQRN